MDSTLKAKIINMKETGVSYSKISESTGLSVNTIKSFFRRNMSQDEEYLSCKNCGQSLSKTSKANFKKFCSDSCRYKWWRKNADGNRECVKTLICKNCGNKFRSYDNKARKYCSHKCYINHRFKR